MNGCLCARRSRLSYARTTLRQALTASRRTVNFFGSGLSTGYDTFVMQLHASVKTLLSAALFTFIPISAMSAGESQNGAAVTSSISTLAGAAAVRVSGTILGPHNVQAVMYATFAPELPRVLLGRYPLTTGADGSFTITLPTAPAYFQGATIKVVVQSLSAVPLASATSQTGEPAVPVPST